MKKTYFQVGDLVTCALRGKGTVIEINNSSIYPIVVKFEINDKATYTYDGRLAEKLNRTLHQGHINIQEPTLKPLTQVGDLVWVKHPWVEVWGLTKVEKINPPCIVSKNGCIWTSWLSIEEGPIWTEMPNMSWEEKVKFAEEIMEIWNKLGFSDPVFIPTANYWLQYRK
jgi:hypothetical protein